MEQQIPSWNFQATKNSILTALAIARQNNLTITDEEIKAHEDKYLKLIEFEQKYPELIKHLEKNGDIKNLALWANDIVLEEGKIFNESLSYINSIIKRYQRQSEGQERITDWNLSRKVQEILTTLDIEKHTELLKDLQNSYETYTRTPEEQVLLDKERERERIAEANTKFLKEVPNKYSLEEILPTIQQFYRFLGINLNFLNDSIALKTQQRMVLALAEKWLDMESEKTGLKNSEVTNLAIIKAAHNEINEQKKGVLISLISIMFPMTNVASMYGINNFSTKLQNAMSRNSSVSNKLFEASSDVGIKLRNWQNKNIQHTQSDHVQEKLSLANNDKILHHVREKLEITKENEKPFEIIVLDLDLEEMIRYTGSLFGMPKGDGWAGYCIGTGTIVIPRDWEEKGLTKLIEHEYTHSQITNERFGLNHAFGLAVCEGRAESQVSKPETYIKQRGLWNLLTESVPELENAMLDYSRSNSVENFDKWNDLIIQKFGLSLWSDIMRVSAFTENSYYRGNQLFLKPEDVLAKMKEYLKKSDLDY